MESRFYLPLLAGLAGALVGFLMREFSSFFQVYRQDKRTLRKVLYDQMEVWFAVRATDACFIATAAQVLAQSLRQKGVPANEAETLMKTMQPQLTRLFRAAELSDPKPLIERYHQSLGELAKVDPILAFQINASVDIRADLQKLVKTAVDTNAFGEVNANLEMLAQVTETVYDQILHNILRSMEEDILRVSMRIHLWTRIKTKRALQRVQQNFHSKAQEEMDKFIDNLLQLAANPTQVNSAMRTQETR
jgi:hypothetical protein